MLQLLFFYTMCEYSYLLTNDPLSWLGHVVVRTLVMPLPSTRLFLKLYFAGKLLWDITTTHVNSALHPSRVAKLSTRFGWDKGGKVNSAGWQICCVIPYGM